MLRSTKVKMSSRLPTIHYSMWQWCGNAVFNSYLVRAHWKLPKSEFCRYRYMKQPVYYILVYTAWWPESWSVGIICSPALQASLSRSLSFSLARRRCSCWTVSNVCYHCCGAGSFLTGSGSRYFFKGSGSSSYKKVGFQPLTFFQNNVPSS